MQGIQILFHGRFAHTVAGEPGNRIPYRSIRIQSRIINSPDIESAITRGRELIREELDTTLLSGCQEALASLDADECMIVEIDEATVLNRKGFTFY